MGLPPQRTWHIRCLQAGWTYGPGRRNNDDHRGEDSDTRAGGRRPTALRTGPHAGRRDAGAPASGTSLAGAARARDAGAGGDPGERVPAERGRRERSVGVRARPHRWLAGLAGRAAAGSRLRRPVLGRVSDADADHVRRIWRGADRGARARTVVARDRGGDRGREPDPAARPAADLPGCVRLPGVRPHGRAARTRSVYARGLPGAHRPDLSVHRLAVSAFPLWTAVHALELRHGAAGARGRAVGAEGGRGRGQPDHGRAERACRGRTGSLAALRRGVRRPEPGDAGARGGRRPQRHDRAGVPRRSARADRRDSHRHGGCRSRPVRRGRRTTVRPAALLATAPARWRWRPASA